MKGNENEEGEEVCLKMRIMQRRRRRRTKRRRRRKRRRYGRK